VVALLAWHIKPLVGTDAGCEAEAERKDVIGEPSCVGIVLFDPQIGLMVEQTVENVRRIAGVCSDHLGIEGRVLVGDVGIEEQPGSLP
jgi:hypothetical protein